MSKEEEKLYPKIKEWLQQYLSDKYKGYAIETTSQTSRQNLDAVLRSKGIEFKEAMGLNIKIDIIGILKKGNEYKFIFVEVNIFLMSFDD